jgi:hypothetical protein
MKSRSSFVFLVVLGALGLAGAEGAAHQWQQSIELRTAVELGRAEVSELSQLQAENRRLRQKQISAAELASLRADHAALIRLRAELETLKNAGGTTGR